MNKIKDIIYNKSDIIIALLILAIAALIIFWRLGIILEYPKAIVGTGDNTENVLTEPTEDDGEAAETGDDGDSTEQTTDDSTDSEATQQEQGEAAQQGDTDNGNADNGDAADNEGDKADDSEGDDEGDSNAGSGQLWDDDKLSKDYEVTITGSTASAAVQSLVDAGIFKDYSEYQKICDDNGFDDEKMRAGVFTFKKGSTKLDIIKIVNWSKG